MIVRNVKDVIGTKDEMRTDNWVSRRVLLKKDGMGFSFHETTIFSGYRKRTYIIKIILKQCGASRAMAKSKPLPTVKIRSARRCGLRS